MNLLDIKKGQLVVLQIAEARPIQTMGGDLFRAGETFKVLGTHGTLVRLSRKSDKAKLTIDPAQVILAPDTSDLTTLKA